MDVSVVKSSRKKYYVYTLAYPDGTVFYVGKGQRVTRGSQVYERMDQHEANATLPLEKIVQYGLNRDKCEVIRSIWANGGEVLKRKVFETDSEKDALIYEWALIYMVYGIHNLTNKDGGARHPAPKHHPKPVVKSPVIVEVKSPVEDAKAPDPVKPARIAKPIMTAQEVGDWLGVGRHYIIKIARRGELVGEQIKRDWQFKLSDVEDYIERCKYQTQKDIKLKQLTKK